jgi:hypothetical protein
VGWQAKRLSRKESTSRKLQACGKFFWGGFHIVFHIHTKMITATALIAKGAGYWWIPGLGAAVSSDDQLPKLAFRQRIPRPTKIIDIFHKLIL